MGAIRISGAIPGPKSQALRERRSKVVTPGLSTLHPIFIDHAEGATVTDVDGNRFLDFTGGIGVLNVGHCHPKVVAAVQKQVQALTHACFQVAGYESYVSVAEALCRLTPGTHEKRALLVSTGAEAVENAVKMARAYTKRAGVLCFEHAFHGRTLLGMSLTGKASPYKAGLGPFAPEVYRLPYPYAYRGIAAPQLDTALKTIVSPTDLAAIILEPVLGEGGFLPAPTAWLAHLREFCDEHGILLIADEVQTSFGRTGTMFGCERLGVVPDLMTMAKSIAGGMPLAAIVGRASIMDAMPSGGVGGTYAGNPVACAAAMAAIEVLEKDVLPDRPNAIGKRICERMLRLQKEVSQIGDVRGLGAMQAVELVRDVATKEPANEQTATVISAARERGVLLLSAGTFGNVLRFLTPLTISDAELDEGLAVVDACLRAGLDRPVVLG